MRFAHAACAVSLAAFATAAACGGSSPPPTSVDGRAGARETNRLGPGDGGDTLTSFEALAALAPSLAPGMRESDRLELTGETDLSRTLPFERDVCVRVTFAASTKVTATLADATGAVLARVDAASSGSLGERGPVCVRARLAKLTVNLHPASPGPLRARLVIWALP